MTIVIVMGVTGVGKTTIGRLLAARLGMEFIDADDWHSADAKLKMASGIPLDDRDREPWLRRLAGLLAERSGRGVSLVLACSALKAAYRRALVGELDGSTAVRWVWLHAPPQVLAQRLAARSGHFMDPHLLQSQFETLEAPRPDECISVESEGDIATVLDRVVAALSQAA